MDAKLKQLMETKNDLFCIALSEVFAESFNSDDEKDSRRGRYMVKAKNDNSIDDMLVAICGYSFETLASMAKDKTEAIYNEIAVALDAVIEEDHILITGEKYPLNVFEECVAEYFVDPADFSDTLQDLCYYLCQNEEELYDLTENIKESASKDRGTLSDKIKTAEALSSNQKTDSEQVSNKRQQDYIFWQ